MQSMINTDRLIMRPFKPEDAEMAFTWFGDPAVMRFIPNGPDDTVAQTKSRLACYQEHQTAYRFSKWIVVDRCSGNAIGDSGLLHMHEHGWIDLGFRFAKPYWGQGYATEAATAWTRAAFGKYHISRLNAFAHIENIASIRILEKLGFQAQYQGSIMGVESIVFSLSREGNREFQVGVRI